MMNFKEFLLSEKAITVKDAKQRAKDIEIKKVDKKAKKLFNDLLDTINSSKYNKTVDFIDEISADPKLKFILSLGFGGEFADLDLKIEEKSTPVKNLIPLQNEIGTDETFKFIFSGKNIDNCFENPAVIKKPIVTLNSKYIIDGHHRWSEIFITNPKANVQCIDIVGKISPLNALKAIQCTIASNLGHVVKTSKKGKNLLELSKGEISKFVKQVSLEAREKFNNYHISDCEHYLLKNCLEMQKNNQPIKDAPVRDIMPQTSKDPDLFSDLDKGITKPE